MPIGPKRELEQPLPTPPAPEGEPQPVEIGEEPEQKIEVEQVPAEQEARPQQEQEEPGGAAPPTVQQEPTTTTPQETTPDAFVSSIEATLAEGLTDAFNTMDEETQQRFKAKGEETAREIAPLLARAKVQVQKVVKLIQSWLRMIPQVNEYFLEKETKIKMDKLMALHEERRNRSVE